MSWEPVIGLEIHAQLATRSKIFSGAPTSYGAEPNEQACLIDLGYPGVLPVLNREAVRLAVRFGLAIGATIAERSVFARKNYFYPDLPKGYQISQYELPVVSGGAITIHVDGASRAINITRAHLEEDAGKSLHENLAGASGIDLNRAGTPLLEIVSEPEMYSAAEAAAYMRAIHQLVCYLGVSDGNMQEGSFRCDANVSLRPSGESELGTRTEIKNLNSFRFVERAIEYEIERQADVLDDGGTIVQETRLLYDPDRDETRPMRGKEEANDYRYFPDPDLLPLVIDQAFVDSEQEALPELPEARRQRFASEYGLREDDIEQLTASRDFADYFESAVKGGAVAREAAKWTLGEVSAALNRDKVAIADAPVRPDALAGLIARIDDGTISGKIAKEVFEGMWAGEGSADQIIESRGLRQISDTSELERIIRDVLSAHPGQVAEYQSGKDKLIGFFVGQVMKETRGKANPGQVNTLLRELLNND